MVVALDQWLFWDCYNVSLCINYSCKVMSSYKINVQGCVIHYFNFSQALEKYNIEKDIAAYIKKEFDKKYNPTWHCITGRNFGSYVTHETKHFIYFYLGQVAVLLFKSGWKQNNYLFITDFTQLCSHLAVFEVNFGRFDISKSLDLKERPHWNKTSK